MPNATHTPPDVPGSTTDVPPPIDYERIPPTGVRKVPVVAIEEGPAVRWGAIFAGFLLSLGGQILLSLLGFAVGLAVMASPARRAEGLGAGTAIWVGLVLVATLYGGGYLAARISGRVRRADGLLSGGLVWALSAVAALWLLGGSAMMAMQGPRFDGPQMQQFGPGPGPAARGASGPAQSTGNPDFALEPQPFPPPPRVTPADLSRAAWGAFAYAAMALLGALAGGARGAAESRARAGAAV